MGRPPRFPTGLILDGTLRVLAGGGPAATTTTAVAAAIGAPSGSLYHRFPSRDLLLARLWVRTVSRFQEVFLAALAVPDDAGQDEVRSAARAAAVAVPGWCRDHLDEARVLLLHRRSDLVGRWPGELDDELAALNTAIGEALRGVARRRYGTTGPAELGRVTFALVDVPYAASRRHVALGRAPPPEVDALVAETVTALLG